jgi:hypothetical protein
MSKPRPGVDSGKRLFACTDLQVWQSVDDQHDQHIVPLVKDLKAIQQRYRALGDELMHNNNKTYITKKELLLVVQWKFAVGKPRHALMKHLNANTESSVQEHSTAAIQLARSVAVGNTETKENAVIIKKAIEALMNLQGVGPATASAVLCLVRPDVFAYMYDETIESCGLKRTYNLNTYLVMNDNCHNIAVKLGNQEWTAARVSRTLWTASRAKANGLQDHTAPIVSSNKLKRVENQSCSEIKTETKRRKRK